MKFDFLFCSERSGSNLITKILNAHPEVCGPFPFHIMETFSLNLFRYGDLSKDENWDILVMDMVDLLNNGIGIWKSKFDLNMIKNNVKTRFVADIYRYVYECEARAMGKNRVFVKNNHVYSYLAHITGSFTESKFVYMVRDPRDMALTWKEAASAPGGIKRGAEQWKKDQSESIKAYGYLKNMGKIHLLKFEDLLRNTEYEARKICDHLGIEFSEKMLEFYKEEGVTENSNRLPSWKDVKKPILKNNFNLYKEKLHEIEIRYIEALCGEEMEFFGYEKEYKQEGNLNELEKNLKPEDNSVSFTETEKQVYKKFNAAREKVAKRKLY